MDMAEVKGLTKTDGWCAVKPVGLILAHALGNYCCKSRSSVSGSGFVSAVSLEEL